MVAVFFALMMAMAQSSEQIAQTSEQASPSSASGGGPSSTQPASLNLPVSLDRIRQGIEEPGIGPLHGLNDAPTFTIQIIEKQQIALEDLINSLDFRGGPAPAGGPYAYEQQRLAFPPVSNPLVQPYAAFSQGELTTVLAENLVGYYLAGKAAGAITRAERARAEAAAREQVARAITDYCAVQPNGGAGIPMCANPSESSLDSAQIPRQP
jgi:hypothetical protein